MGTRTRKKRRKRRGNGKGIRKRNRIMGKGFEGNEMGNGQYAIPKFSSPLR